jgi:hypothetical protein
LGIYRLFILNGHESHHSDAFEQHCKKNKIIILCMPAHFFHILQPLNVAYFSFLKKAYGTQIKKLVRARISHITKEDFFPAFCDAFKKSLTESNIRAGFQGAGLVPLNPDIVIAKLDIKLQIPTSSRPLTRKSLFWAFRTPNNPTKATSQSEFIKSRIARYQNSFPTSIYNGIDQIAKGAKQIIHKMALLQAEVAEFRKANTLINKRRKAKKTRIRLEGSLNLQNVQNLQDQKDIAQQIQQKMRENSAGSNRGQSRQRYYGNCGKPGHNARTCSIDIKSSGEAYSD